MRPRLDRLLALAVPLLVLGALAGWVVWRRPNHVEVVVRQERLDAAGPRLGAGYALGQTFRSPRDGLAGMEFLLVAYDADTPLPAGTELTLTLERLDVPGAEPLRASAPLGGRRHNDPVPFDWPALNDSEGALYRATLGATGGAAVSVWYASADAYVGGEMLLDGEPAAGDLRFVARYAHTPADALEYVLAEAWAGLRYLPGLVLLLVPGWAVTVLVPLPGWVDGWGRAALALAAAPAFWALAALWSGVAGASLAGAPAWILVGLTGSAGAAALATRRAAPRQREPWPSDPLVHGAMLLVLALATATRVLHVRDLVVPNWVDGVHHTLITQLIAEGGGVPATYAPLLPVGDFHYHFGFHASAAALGWLGGLGAPDAVLFLGQALSALSPLSAYLLTLWLARDRWAAAGAAVVVAALSYLPAYYTSWGRYPQLAGLVMLPAACLLGEEAVRRPGRRTLAAGALLGAGLALTHYRVLIFFGAFWVAGPLYAVVARARRGAWPPRRAVARMGLLAVASLLLAAPWVLRFAGQVLPSVGQVYGGLALDDPGRNAPSWGLMTAYWMRPLLVAAGLGLVVAAARRRWGIVFLGAWVGLWALAANLRLVGLRDTWVLDNVAVQISVWLPMAAFCGTLAAEAASAALALAGRLRPGLAAPPLRSALLCAAAVGLTAVGSWRHLGIVNPVTVLATEDDLAAMEWVREQLPEDALVAVNSRVWQGTLHMGTDGGCWLPLLAGRQVTLPAVLYHLGAPEYVRGVNDLALAVEGAASPDDPGLLARLEAAGVTHIYVGARGGPLMPVALDPSPHYRQIYSRGPVRVYEFAGKAREHE